MSSESSNRNAGNALTLCRGADEDTPTWKPHTLSEEDDPGAGGALMPIQRPWVLVRV